MHEEHKKVDQFLFQGYINLKSPKLEEVFFGDKVIVIFDNVPYHRNVTSLSPNRILKHFPPWSMMLIPIEEAFSVLKTEKES